MHNKEKYRFTEKYILMLGTCSCLTRAARMEDVSDALKSKPMRARQRENPSEWLSRAKQCRMHEYRFKENIYFMYGRRAGLTRIACMIDVSGALQSKLWL